MIPPIQKCFVGFSNNDQVKRSRDRAQNQPWSIVLTVMSKDWRVLPALDMKDGGEHAGGGGADGPNRIRRYREKAAIKVGGGETTLLRPKQKANDEGSIPKESPDTALNSRTRGHTIGVSAGTGGYLHSLSSETS